MTPIDYLNHVKIRGNEVSDNNSINSSLLSPPETPTEEHEIPFKPDMTDHTSLSMKKKKHRKLPGRSNKERSDLISFPPVSFNDVRTIGTKCCVLEESRSLPGLYSLSLENQPPPTQLQGRKHISTNHTSSRRWTLPNKSNATHGVTTLSPQDQKATFAKGSVNPAMITLRRATPTNKTKPRQASITFFPEPTFRSERPKILTYLSNTFSVAREEHDVAYQKSPLAEQLQRKSISNGKCHSGMGFIASPVQTEVDISPIPFQSKAGEIARNSRRCSTKYVSGTSVFEVIWDENDTASSENNSSPQQPHDSPKTRRKSVAVEQLELQLLRSSGNASTQDIFDDEPISRRTSGISFVGRGKENDAFYEALQRNMERLVHISRLQNLPRSVSGKSLKAARQAQLRNSSSPQSIEEVDSEIVPDLTKQSVNNYPIAEQLEFCKRNERRQ